jgi:CRP-like cAMP-binding protein
MTQLLIRKLQHFASLSETEKQVLAGATARTLAFRPGEDLVHEGEEPAECHLVLDGVLCRYKLLGEGKRQIVALLLAGDLCDLCGLMMGRMDHSVGTLSAGTVAVIPRQMLQGMLERHPRIARALWQEMVVDASITREWVANTGRRSAYQRIAHLLCEVGRRLQAVGHASGDAFEWPLTQAEAADAVGLSTVHVNRMLQQLRSEGLIEMQGSAVRILDWPGLERAGEFSADYLFLNAGSRNRTLDRPFHASMP